MFPRYWWQSLIHYCFDHYACSTERTFRQDFLEILPLHNFVNISTINPLYLMVSSLLSTNHRLDIFSRNSEDRRYQVLSVTGHRFKSTSRRQILIHYYVVENKFFRIARGFWRNVSLVLIVVRRSSINNFMNIITRHGKSHVWS